MPRPKSYQTAQTAEGADRSRKLSARGGLRRRARHFGSTAQKAAQGTFACSGTFLDDPVLWGERKVRDDAFVVEVGSDGRTVTGSGESFYGRYDVEGTLDRTGGQSYAKLRIHKLKKLKPWYYEHCYVCGSDEKSDGDLLLCDGQDGRSPASHAIDATLFP